MSTLTIGNAGVNGFQPSTVGGTGTTAKIFPSLLGPTFPANGFTNPTYTGAGAVPATVNIANNGVSNGQIVTIKAGGTLYVGDTADPTINFVLQYGTSLTASDNTTVVTLSAVQDLDVETQYPFAVEVQLQGDNTSGTLQVVSAQVVCGGVVGSVTKTDLPAGSPPEPSVVDFSVAIPFCVGVTFGVSDADNTASLYQFVAEC